MSCEDVSKQEGTVNSIINQHGKEEAKEYNLRLVGAGSAIPDNVHGFILDYNSEQKLTIPEARKLYIQGTEKLLNMINNSEELRPFMHEYPFTEKNIDYKLSFHNKDRSFVEPPYVAYVFLSKNNVVYVFHDNKKGKFIDEMDFSEPYLEAVRIVREEQGK